MELKLQLFVENAASKHKSVIIVGIAETIRLTLLYFKLTSPFSKKPNQLGAAKKISVSPEGVSMLTLDEGTYAVRLARNTLEECINETSIEMDKPPEEFKELRGVFVTLRKKEGLRGCIGYPLPISPLYSAIVDSAINAATKDPRFLPVQSDELDDIIVEVTVLTPPEVITVEPKDLPENIEIGRHGLIVKKGPYQGLLLPQVPIEHGMDVEDFLSHTCMKAGLSPVAWLEEGTEVSRFEGQIFEEVEQNGEVVEKKLM